MCGRMQHKSFKVMMAREETAMQTLLTCLFRVCVCVCGKNVRFLVKQQSDFSQSHTFGDQTSPKLRRDTGFHWTRKWK